MQPNTTRTHVRGPEMTHMLAFLWYFFTVYLGIYSNSPSRNSLVLIWHSAHLTEGTEKCYPLLFKIIICQHFQVGIHLSISFLTSKLVSCVCALCKTLCWVLQVQHLLKLCSLLPGGGGSAGGAPCPAESAWAWAAFRRWLSILTSCVASDKGTNL